MIIHEKYFSREKQIDKNGNEDHILLCYGDGEYEVENLTGLFKDLRNIHGKCISSIYIDNDGEAKKIGWSFLKKAKYNDCNEYYLQETWVTVINDIQTTINYVYFN